MRGILFLVIFFFAQRIHAQDFSIVFLNKKLDKAELPEEEVKKLMDGHFANMARLAKESKLWAAGPFDGGGGIFIFKSGSQDDVKEWIKTDPAIQANRWDLEVFPNIPRFGSVCAVGEKYEMTNYFFVRYAAKNENTGTNQLHQDYIKSWWDTGSVIAEGSLGGSNGSILVLREEPAPEKIADDPALKKVALTASLKKLFIAKGSFCEPK